MKRRSIAILLGLLILVGLTGCGSSSGVGSYKADSNSAGAAMNAPTPSAAQMEMADDGYWAAQEMDVPSGGEGAEGRTTLPDGVKMIYRANLELETTEFEQAAAQVKALTNQLGGYFEEQNTYTRGGGYRSASYTVRVPAARFEEFLTQIGDVCTVVRQSQSADDVSEYYYDMESRLETAKIKLDRLQELLSRAEEMEDIITLEGAISDTEYQIESLSGEKRHYDALIGYSTIYVNLSEVYRITEVETAPLTFGQRMSLAFRDGLRSFGDGLEDFLEWLAYNWLSLLVFAAVIVVIVKLVKRGRRRAAAGKAEKNHKKLFGKKDSNPAEAAQEQDKNE